MHGKLLSIEQQTVDNTACCRYQSGILIPDNKQKAVLVPNTLTKADIVSAIQTENGYPRKRSSELVETLLDIIKNTLASGNDVLISGFGKFNVVDKNDRKGRNPATGEDMMLPARKVVTFKCSGKLRDRVNG
jgi:integration host factor subunit alpha